MNLAEFKKQYPMYSNIPDEELAQRLHSSFYSNMKYEDFARQIGLLPAAGEIPDYRTLDQQRASAERPTAPTIEERVEDALGSARETIERMGSDIYSRGRASADVARTFAQSMVAAPASGIIGLLSNLSPDVTAGGAIEIMKDVEQRLTHKPETEEAKKIMGIISEAVAPALEKYEGFKQAQGDAVFDDTGSASLSTMAYVAPDAVIESIPLLSMATRKIRGTGGVRTDVTKKDVNRAIQETTVDVEGLRNATRNAFKEIEDAKFRFSNSGIRRLTNDLRAAIGGRSSETAKVGVEVINDAIRRLQNNPTPRMLDEVYNDINAIAGRGDDLSSTIAIQAKKEIMKFMDTNTGRDFVINLKDVKKMNKSPATSLKRTR